MSNTSDFEVSEKRIELVATKNDPAVFIVSKDSPAAFSADHYYPVEILTEEVVKYAWIRAAKDMHEGMEKVIIRAKNSSDVISLKETKLYFLHNAKTGLQREIVSPETWQSAVNSVPSGRAYEWSLRVSLWWRFTIQDAIIIR